MNLQKYFIKRSIINFDLFNRRTLKQVLRLVKKETKYKK